MSTSLRAKLVRTMTATLIVVSTATLEARERPLTRLSRYAVALAGRLGKGESDLVPLR
ncbi:MAG TPA: hypothetical protein VJ860_08665 [Polyangia bacterium]|jgi:hypothetical protein|nr:hypothetical protein [Polyangia bacterium]